MFTGIVEETGLVEKVTPGGSNLHIWMRAPMADSLSPDQSVAHNGACLTVDECENGRYRVTVIEETLRRTNLKELRVNNRVNLERCMKAGGRFDGHIVQGHVDCIGECRQIENRDGSWVFTFSHPASPELVTVEKGSVTVNGVSLTVVASRKDSFAVAVIPYTYEHTNFCEFQKGTPVNLEFDIIGKYVARILEARS